MLQKTMMNKEEQNAYINEEEFSFMNQPDIELSNLENKIKEQEKILSDLKFLMETRKESITDKELESERAFQTIESNIKKLYSMKEEWNQIYEKIKKLLVSMEKGEQSNEEKEEQWNWIKKSISQYYSSSDSIQEEILKNNANILKLFDTGKEYNGKQKEEKIEDIPLKEIKLKEESEVPENNILTISEKQNQVVLPYTKSELQEYLKQYPDKYLSYEDVINKEFIYPLSYYTKYPNIARFREMYSLIRDREGKTILEALKYGIEFMFRYEINPAIIAACKTQSQFEIYLENMEKKTLENFKEFVIHFEMNPTSIY